MTRSAIHIRIVILNFDTDLWCEVCDAACATTVTYLVEEGGAVPAGLHQVTWCETCERHQLR